MGILAGALVSLLLLILLCGLTVVHNVFIVVAYILEGKGLSTLARRRGIEKPWLAWVPVARVWLLGAVSDQYRYVSHGQIRNRRNLLLWLDILVVIVTSIVTVCLLFWFMRLAFAIPGWDADRIFSTVLMSFGGIGLYLLSFLLVTVAMTVFRYIAYHDLFRSCEPEKCLLYLLLSIFIPYSRPFFVYGCRNKDLGMPPRKDSQETSAA